MEHALLGFKKVLEKGWQHMLLGSATLVLESVMEFVQLIESFASLNERLVFLFLHFLKFRQAPCFCIDEGEGGSWGQTSTN